MQLINELEISGCFGVRCQVESHKDFELKFQSYFMLKNGSVVLALLFTVSMLEGCQRMSYSVCFEVVGLSQVAHDQKNFPRCLC